MSETISIRAHFDGKTIVPDEPVSLPENVALVIDIRKSSEQAPDTERATIVARQLGGLQRLKEMALNDPVIPAEALRRENMYDDLGF